jgi:hypothetical protein
MGGMSLDQRLAPPPDAETRHRGPAAAAAPPARRRARRLTSSAGWLRLISPVAVLILWQAVSEAGLISRQKLPPPDRDLADRDQPDHHQFARLRDAPGRDADLA